MATLLTLKDIIKEDANMNQLEFCIFRNNHHHQGDDDGDEFESARKINRSRHFLEFFL